MIIVALVALGIGGYLYHDHVTPTMEKADALYSSGDQQHALKMYAALLVKDQNMEAAKKLGLHFLPSKPETGIGYLIPVAQDGDVESQKIVAFHYLDSGEPEKAALYLRLAAKDPEIAKILVNMRYEDACGVKKGASLFPSRNLGLAMWH